MAKADLKRMLLAAEGKREKPYRCFVPSGRSGFYIYVVSVVDHPGVSKIGRTVKWNNRRKAYANWNLRPGDGIDQERVYCITDEFVDLNAVEAAILEAAPWPVRSGSEWFLVDFDDACRHVEEMLCVGGLSYTEL